MPTKTTKTRFPGVYTRESKKRRHAGRPDVVFYYCIHANGKRLWYKAGWRSEGMTAQAAAGMRSRALMSGRGQKVPTPTVKEMFEAAVPLLKELAPNTIRNYHQAFRGYIMPTFGSTLLDTVTSQSLQKFYMQLRETGKSASTIEQIISCFLAAWRRTLRAGKHAVQLPGDIQLPKAKQHRHDRYLTRQEAWDLIHALRITSPIWADMAEFSLCTGARVGEIGSLTPSGVHFDSGTAEVTGKTGHRVLQLSAQACAILRRNMGGVPSHKKIFPVSVGSHAAFNKAVDQLGLNPAGIPKSQRVVFHTLRHTFASWLAIDGVPLYTIKELMGHASIKMTERYAHLCPDLHKSAVDRISHIFNSPSDGYGTATR